MELEVEGYLSGLNILIDEDNGCVAMNNRARSIIPGLFNAVISDDSYSDYGEIMTEMIMAENTDST